MLSWQLAIILAAVSGIAAFVVWDVIKPLIGGSDDQ